MSTAAGYVNVPSFAPHLKIRSLARPHRKAFGATKGSSGYRRIQGLSGLGDTCWLTAAGQSVCGAGDPTGQTTTPVCLSPSVPQNNANGPATAPDGTTWYFTQSGTNLTGNPSSHNLRSYRFAYHSGFNDIYRQVGGGGCSGFNCSQVSVGPGGSITFAGGSPAEPPCGNASSAGTPTTSSGCYTDPASGQEVCGAGVVQQYPTQENVYPTPTGYSSGYPYSAIQTNTDAPYTAMPAASAAPISAPSTSPFANIPTWALVGGGVVGVIVLIKVMKKR